MSEQPTPVAGNHLGRLAKVGLFLATLFLFILAITLMKEGSRALGPLVRDHFQVDNAANSMGLLSLLVTGTTYLVGLLVGVALLSTGWLDGVKHHHFRRHVACRFVAE